MGYILVGGLFVLAGLSGDYVMRGTESGWMLGVFGAGMLLFGIFRIANPQVECRVCGETMPKSSFEQHLVGEHADLMTQTRGPAPGTGQFPSAVCPHCDAAMPSHKLLTHIRLAHVERFGQASSVDDERK